MIDLDSCNKATVLFLFVGTILILPFLYIYDGTELIKSCNWYQKLNPIVRSVLYIVTFIINKTVVVFAIIHGFLLVLAAILALYLYLGHCP